MSKHHKKVLIIGHNVLDHQTAFGKTLISFFRSWDPDCLAQLYFHSEVPTTELCRHYFRITDTDALRSIFKRKSGTVGRSFDQTQIEPKRTVSRTDEGVKKKLYSFGRKRTSYIYMARNTVWRLSRWYSDALKKWLRDFAPDVIFFAAGDYAFAYRIAYTISEQLNIPIVTYCCDDYFVNRLNPRSVFSKLVYQNLMKHVRRCVQRSACLITICEQMTQAYRRFFDKPIHTVYTGYSAEGQPYHGGQSIVYLGNLGFSRYQSLIDIGRALQKLSQETGNDWHLDLYSAENREEILSQLTAENGIRFHGAVSHAQVQDIIDNSLLVVHAESFLPKNIYKVRFSISTKIADLLACRRCIFAYGPAEIASIEYLQQNQAACVVSDPQRLLETLRTVLTDTSLQEKITQNAFALAQRNHDKDLIPDRIQAIIEQI